MRQEERELKSALTALAREQRVLEAARARTQAARVVAAAAALRVSAGRVDTAARLLGWHRTQLQRLLKAHADVAALANVHEGLRRTMVAEAPPTVGTE